MNRLTMTVSAGALALVLGTAALAAPGMGKDPHDANGDGVVTREEALAHAGKMFERLDADGNGQLDEADREARARERFARLDTDGNGAISEEEFLAARKQRIERRKHRAEGAMAMQGHPHRGRRGRGMMAMHMLRMADTNQDRVVTRAEFDAAVTEHFDRIDGNKDGQLSEDERKAAREALREKMREKMREHRERMRADRSGTQG